VPDTPDLSPVVEMLERQCADGFQPGAQLYVSRHGTPLLDVAVGESRPGRALLADDLMLWYSSGKPVTTVAVLQLWERGLLGLDDPIGRYLPGFGAGKERATIRHVLTHTAGFTMAGPGEPFDRDLPYDEVIARITAHPAEWEPGTRAGYHPSTGWKVLGAIVQLIDGRPIDRYLSEEVLPVAGMTGSHLGIDPDTQSALGDRLVPVHWTGHALAIPTADGGIRMWEYHIEKIHNEAWHVAKVEPGGGMRGPARDLGRFYESLLGYGATPVAPGGGAGAPTDAAMSRPAKSHEHRATPVAPGGGAGAPTDAAMSRPAKSHEHRGRLLDPRTVEVMTAVHRYGVPDVTLGGMKIPWGLGVQVAGGMTGGVGRRSFGHNGMASSRGMADPDAGLVLVFVTNGLTDPLRNEQRMFEVVDGIYSALGDDVAHLRLPAKPLPEAFRLGAR
jgi:CubicO group peptidase (beta-lactamase class C family)